MPEQVINMNDLVKALDEDYKAEGTQGNASDSALLKALDVANNAISQFSKAKKNDVTEPDSDPDPIIPEEITEDPADLTSEKKMLKSLHAQVSTLKNELNQEKIGFTDYFEKVFDGFYAGMNQMVKAMDTMGKRVEASTTLLKSVQEGTVSLIKAKLEDNKAAREFMKAQQTPAEQQAPKRQPQLPPQLSLFHGLQNAHAINFQKSKMGNEDPGGVKPKYNEQQLFKAMTEGKINDDDVEFYQQNGDLPNGKALN